MSSSRFFRIILPFCLCGLVAAWPEVQIGETTLIGRFDTVLVDTYEFFGGIPFAEPPVGNLRFAPPVIKLEPGVPVFDATQFGEACLQNAPLPINLPFPTPAQSEDCLTVNVLRPAGVDEDSALPVMVWVYGGGFLGGWSSVYDGTLIVGQSKLRGTPIIYVNFNYRLGALGFPQGEEAERRGATNLGNKDVIAALTWVKNNIGAFGGDPEKVTVFGESAGSIIISQLLLNQSFDLARAAILESGSAATNRLLRAADREDIWQAFVSEVPDCSGVPRNNTFDCLRTASPDTIHKATDSARGMAQEEYPFAPVIDGPGGMIPDHPSKLFGRGQFARIPLIMGTNLDEGTLFTPSTFDSSSTLKQWLFSNTTPSPVSPDEQNFVINKILELYPEVPAQGSPFNTGDDTFGLHPEYKRLSAIFGDVAFTSLRRELAQVASQYGVKVFAYLFMDPQLSILSEMRRLGVYHSSEVPYVYGIALNGLSSLALSRVMVEYWVAFATSLDPNEGQLIPRATWTQYTPEAEDVLQLNGHNTTMIPDTFREEQISFLNQHALALLH